MNQQVFVHATRDNTAQNAVIYTSAKSAPIITHFLVEKKTKKHRTKGKIEYKTFSGKATEGTAQEYV